MNEGDRVIGCWGDRENEGRRGHWRGCAVLLPEFSVPKRRRRGSLTPYHPNTLSPSLDGLDHRTRPDGVAGGLAVGAGEGAEGGLADRLGEVGGEDFAGDGVDHGGEDLRRVMGDREHPVGAGGD